MRFVASVNALVFAAGRSSSELMSSLLPVPESINREDIFVMRGKGGGTPVRHASEQSTYARQQQQTCIFIKIAALEMRGLPGFARVASSDAAVACCKAEQPKYLAES